MLATYLLWQKENNMPKVVHLAQYYWPHVGGVENHLAHVTTELHQQGYQQSIITLQHDPSLPLHAIYHHIQLYRVPLAHIKNKLTHKLSVWARLWQLRAELFNADIIHIHDVFWWLIPLLPFLNRQKLYITFHGYEGNDAPQWNQIAWHRLAAWWTHGNICIGDFHRSWYGVRPTSVSYGATDDSRQKAKKKSAVKKKEIIFVGRLEEDNGIQQYLEAIKILTEKKHPVHLDVYGDGSLAQACQVFIKEHHLPVTFLGFVANAAKKIPDYDIAFISRYLGILEALSTEVPVVAQYNNQIKHDYLALAPFAKWITMVQKPETIAQAVIQSKPLPKAASDWARAQTWQKMAQLYQQLWRRTIK